MSWRVVEDAYRAVAGQPPRCSAAEYVEALSKAEKGDVRQRVLLLAARRAAAYEALAEYDREPNDVNMVAAADAMATASMARLDGEHPRATIVRLLPSYPQRPANEGLLSPLASAGVRERRLGETLGQAIDRVSREEQAFLWATDVALGR